MSRLHSLVNPLFTMLILVVYDLHDARRRARLSRLLRAYGTRVQNSVFECHLEAHQFRQLYKRINLLLSEPQPEESIRIYPLTRQSQKRIRYWGNSPLTEDPPYYLV